ncbi:MAG TPA: hypothetical protein VFN53_02875 [Acidobacteriaceae bacterium]|nr:hypothetical protein [Acidobacteriaceae bacterium]
MPFPASLTQTLNDFRVAPYPSVTGPTQPISIRSLGEFAFALIWACLLLISFIGWGKLLSKVLRVRGLPSSVACSLGIAVILFTGGWLNLFHAVYPSILIALALTGVLLYFLMRKESSDAYNWLNFWNVASRSSRALIVLTFLLLVLRVAATVRLATYHNYDDGTAYLAFPQKMLNAHQFAADPFSDRRVISSLGGSYLLQAFVVAATSLANVGMADRSLGLIIMFFAIFDIGIAFSSSVGRIAFMALIAYLVPQETFNLTFTVLPIPILLAMIWAVYKTLKAAETENWRFAAIAGAIGGGAICLKSTFLPYVGSLALFPYLLFLWNRNRAQSMKLPMIAGAASLVVLAAWMLAMKQTSGTFLFPLLGHGTDYSSYHSLPHLSRFAGKQALIRTFLQGAALLVLAAVRYLAGIRDVESGLTFNVLIASAVAITALNYESGADYIWRYNFPQFFTALIIFSAASLGAKGVSLSHFGILNRSVAVAAFTLCIFYYDVGGGALAPFSQMAKQLAQYPCDLRASLSGTRLTSPELRARYDEIEHAFLPNSVALDNTSRTFLLATSRKGRTVFIDDWPGAAGPPPGWPFTNNPEDVARYLRGNSVRYIVFDHAYADWMDMISCQSLVNQTHYSQLDHALERLTFVAHHQFRQLQSMHHSLYDDGRISVIDLETPAGHDNNDNTAWTLYTSDTQMCSVIAQRYTSTHASYPYSASAICK